MVGRARISTQYVGLEQARAVGLGLRMQRGAVLVVYDACTNDVMSACSSARLKSVNRQPPPRQTARRWNAGSSHATTMATQQDLQELLRLQTARKMPMKDAMAQIKALQSASLRRPVTHLQAANWQT